MFTVRKQQMHAMIAARQDEFFESMMIQLMAAHPSLVSISGHAGLVRLARAMMSAAIRKGITNTRDVAAYVETAVVVGDEDACDAMWEKHMRCLSQPVEFRREKLRAAVFGRLM